MGIKRMAVPVLARQMLTATQHGVSVAELASACEVHRTTAWRWLRKLPDVICVTSGRYALAVSQQEIEAAQAVLERAKRDGKL